jgi:thymidylate kinase
MVATLNELDTSIKYNLADTIVVELVGPAGAGKTTFCSALGRSTERILLKKAPNTAVRADRIFFLRYGLQAAFTCFRLSALNGENFFRRKLAWITILEGWPHVLQKIKAQPGNIIILDQGPVYILTKLNMVASGGLNGGDGEKWWRRIYREWASVLDVVVLLDASNSSLTDRIRSRPKWHIMKDQPDDEVFHFLGNYRQAYERVLSRLTAYGDHPRVLSIKTDQEALDNSVGQLLAEFDVTNLRSEGSV